jgi:predicted nucleotidyltransferase
MNRLVDEKLEQLTGVCMRHNVRTLELFGSAAGGGRFQINTSDLDFLVEFGELSGGEHADAYFGLLEALEDLFQRPIDLVMTSAIKNPYFKEGIALSRVVVYTA